MHVQLRNKAASSRPILIFVICGMSPVAAARGRDGGSHRGCAAADRKPGELVRVCSGRYPPIMTCSVLLDLDGTLIDSYPGILSSCLAALRALGHEPDESLDIRRVIGPPLEDSMQILLRSFGDDRVGEAVAAFRQHYGESGLLGSVLYPGIGKSLEEMQRAGLRIYLATSKRAIFASRILDHLKLTAYFDGIHGSVPSGELDHKPELLAHILSKHSLPPSHSLMVGDRRYDISGAHAVGMRGLGVLWGYGTRDELETAGADQLVDSPADLARTVLAMVNAKQTPA
jgi:phosphoglycolate phosphatase